MTSCKGSVRRYSCNRRDSRLGSARPSLSSTRSLSCHDVLRPCPNVASSRIPIETDQEQNEELAPPDRCVPSIDHEQQPQHDRYADRDHDEVGDPSEVTIDPEPADPAQRGDTYRGCPLIARERGGEEERGGRWSEVGELVDEDAAGWEGGDVGAWVDGIDRERGDGREER